MKCTMCGTPHNSSYAWWETVHDNGQNVCQPCGGKVKHRNLIRVNKKPHLATVHKIRSPYTTYSKHLPSEVLQD